MYTIYCTTQSNDNYQFNLKPLYGISIASYPSSLFLYFFPFAAYCPKEPNSNPNSHILIHPKSVSVYASLQHPHTSVKSRIIQHPAVIFGSTRPYAYTATTLSLVHCNWLVALHITLPMTLVLSLFILFMMELMNFILVMVHLFLFLILVLWYYTPQTFLLSLIMSFMLPAYLVIFSLYLNYVKTIIYQLLSFLNLFM